MQQGDVAGEGSVWWGNMVDQLLPVTMGFPCSSSTAEGRK